MKPQFKNGYSYAKAAMPAKSGYTAPAAAAQTKTVYTPRPPQIKNTYTDLEKERAVDELWAKYGSQLMGESDVPRPTQIKNTTIKPENKNIQTVQAGKSTIRVRDDGSTIHYDSDTAIDLFDFLDYLAGNYGPNNEMAETVKVEKPAEPDVIAGAAQYPSVQGKPVMKYENMVNPPKEEYQTKSSDLEREASNNNIVKRIAGTMEVKPKEIDVLKDNIPEYVPKAFDILATKYSDIPFSDINVSAGDTKNMVYGGNYDETGLNLDGGKPNAFQHIYWAALMTDIVGSDEARKFTTAHETYTKDEYAEGALYSQDDIGKIAGKENETNYSYPTRQQHSAMDLQNNEIGIQIALNTPTEQAEIEKELAEMLGEGETIESLRKQFPNHTDRQILLIKKAIEAVENGEAAIIWDYPAI